MPKDADPLAFLLALNLALAAKEKAGEPIVPPGLPLPEAERAAFVTDGPSARIGRVSARMTR